MLENGEKIRNAAAIVSAFASIAVLIGGVFGYILVDRHKVETIRLQGDIAKVDIELREIEREVAAVRSSLECGGCDKTGKCVVDDDMQSIYPLLLGADVIILASPIFFYGITAQAKALIDRAQAMWSKRMLEKSPEERKTYESGRGYLIAVGASKGENLFEAAELTAKYFFDALDMSYNRGIFFRRLEKKFAVQEHPETLQEALNLGRIAVST